MTRPLWQQAFRSRQAARRVAVVAVLAVGALVRPARADITNRNLLPIGEREAFMANAGVTSASAGAVFFNPANLARLEHPTLSLSGTTLLAFNITTDALLVIEGEDQPFEASGFLPIPASLVSTYKLGPWSLATSVMVPDVAQFENRQTFDSASARTTILQKNSRNDLWLGLSAARRLGSRVSVGVSLFGVQRTRSELLIFQVAGTAAGAGMPQEVAQVTSNTESSVTGLTAVGGVHVQLSPILGVGARIQSPLVSLIDQGEIYQSALTAGSMPGFAEAEVELDTVRDPLPMDLGLGVAVRPVRGVELVADANLQLGQDYAEYEDPALAPSQVDLEPAFRASLAAEVELGTMAMMRAGILYNGSAAGELGEGGAREDYLGVTGGLTWHGERTRTGLGGFYLRSSGELVPLGDPTRTVAARSTIFGVLFTTAYQL